MDAKLLIPSAEERDEYESLPTDSLATNMLAGAAAGVMEHCVMYPLDSIKTRMQSLKPNPKAAYRSVPEALHKMLTQEGIWRGGYRGMSAVVWGAGPAHALYFSCYEKMKRVLSGTQHGSHNPLAQGSAGCLATILHDAVMNPAEVVKQRMQMFNSPYKSSINCALQVWRSEGIRAFYRSYTTQLSMNVPTSSLHFVMYEFMQEVCNKDRNYSPVAHMMSGGIAGAVSSAVTTPLDVCKTLLNTQEKQALESSKQSHISGMFNAATTIYKCCGPKGYFQGLQARVLYSMPATAISWSVYEFFKYVINNRNHRHHNQSHSVHVQRFTNDMKPISKWENTSDLVVPSVTHSTVIAASGDDSPANLLGGLSG